MTSPPGAERADEAVELLRALVQEARQHTLLLARIADELAALRRPAPPAGARERQDPPPGHPSVGGRGDQTEPGPPAGPFDVQDLAAVLPEHGGGVHLHLTDRRRAGHHRPGRQHRPRPGGAGRLGPGGHP